MLLAEIHGKSLEAARDSEDYLTSAVFGHLRYVPPSIYWADLFARARGLPDGSGRQVALSNYLDASKVSVSRYDSLAVHFWSCHREWGEPDLLLYFGGGNQRPLVVLIEVKLWSGKSGEGEHDQLARYVRILKDLPALRLGLPADALRALVYLTPRDSLSEVEASVEHLPSPQDDRLGLFMLQWQDVQVVASRSSLRVDDPGRMILGDVARFLRRLDLDYFRGFDRLAGLPWLTESDGAFYVTASAVGGAKVSKSPGEAPFQGFTRLAVLDMILTKKGRWAQ